MVSIARPHARAGRPDDVTQRCSATAAGRCRRRRSTSFPCPAR